MAELREKIREYRLRWYGHVKRMEENEFVRWSGGTRNKEERTPKSDGWAVFGMMGEWWMGCVRDDGRVVDLDKVDDRIEWRRCRDDPTSLEGTNGKMMMIMMMHSSDNIKTFKCLCILTSNRNHSEILLNYRLEDELFFITN